MCPALLALLRRVRLTHVLTLVIVVVVTLVVREGLTIEGGVARHLRPRVQIFSPSTTAIPPRPTPSDPTTPRPTPFHPTTPRTAPLRPQIGVSASSALTCTFIPPDYKFGTDVYFHPPEPDPNHAPRLPRLLHSPAHLCSDHAPFLVILVLSSYQGRGVRERRAIRATYGSVARGGAWPGRHLPHPPGLVFLLGAPPNGSEEQRVRDEHAQFGDLLVADFVDSYGNVSVKVLSGMRWVLASCPATRFLLKTDDDTFVNVPLLHAFLRGLRQAHTRSVYGTPYLAAHVLRDGVWGVSQDAFPFDHYPVYMSGTGYVLSADAARAVVLRCDSVPSLPIEDALVTGVLAQVAGVRRVGCAGFTHHEEGPPDACDFVLDTRLLGNRLLGVEKEKLWLWLKVGDHTACT